MAKDKKRIVPLYWWRRLSQALFLLLFLFLFRKTDYGDKDRIEYAVNIFFRWDPLVASSAMLAAKTFISLLIPSLAVVALTFLLGRFFCGWVCPLGTCLDMAHKVVPPRSDGAERRFRAIKYYLLAVILVAALFGVPLVGYFDPFSILVRGMTLAVDPGFNAAVSYPLDAIFNYGLEHDSEWMMSASDTVKQGLRNRVLPFKQSVFAMALPSLLILFLVFALERIERRFWCRNLCPLGAMLALIGRVALLRMHPGKACKADGCTNCIDICRMRAIDDEGKVSPEACNLCLDCLASCETGIISFKFKRPRAAPAGMGPSRRGFAGTVAAGLLASLFFKARAIGKPPDPLLIRPPGALDEPEFLARCVRCGECMKVCITNALQPTFLEAGSEGMFSPVVVPRLGYCEYNCTLCGQVCPTGAIRELAKADKQKVRIGRAVFDRNRCVPWAQGLPCLVCEEMCPLPEKAIRMREEKAVNPEGLEVTVKRPYLVEHLCIGCGTCENVCPLDGESAVRVTSEGESRNPDNAVDGNLSLKRNDATAQRK